MPRAFPAVRRVTGKFNRGNERVEKHMPFRSFTPEVKRVILAAIKAGEFGTSAARKARISERTLAHWLKLGEDALERKAEGEKLDAQDEEFAEFYLDVYAAEGEEEATVVKEVRDAGRAGNWVASMTFLERRFGRRWRKTETTEIVGAGGGPVQIEIDNSDAKIAEVLEVLQAAGVLPEGIKGLPAAATADE